METRIGEVFREARRRREVDLAQVEEATRIRQRYLRAIEAEEWSALPGGFYTRGFIRAYASFLGLDGDRLAEDYREGVEGASREWPALPEGGAEATRGGRERHVPAAGPLTAVAVLAAAALVVILLPSGGDGGGTPSAPVKRTAPPTQSTPDLATRKRPAPFGTSVRLTATAEIWVCLLDGTGNALVDGKILAGGAEAGPFHSDSFTVSFGNGEVSMLIDGKEAAIPPTPSPVGYSIDPAGELTELSEAERPTCT